MPAAILDAFGGGCARLVGLGVLVALVAAAGLSLAPAAADGHPGDLELVLSLTGDSDNVVPPGSELSVNAALRYSPRSELGLPWTGLRDQLSVSGAGGASTLRISGDLEWDGAARQRLDLPAQTPLLGQLPTPIGSAGLMVKAFDGRTLVARANNSKLFIFDSDTLEHKATIEPPTGADENANSGFGASEAVASGGAGAIHGLAIAVWHETPSRAWLFVGSWHDTVEATDQIGRLYKFRLDWGDDDDVTVTAEGTMEPTLAETNNRWTGAAAYYGAAVAISADGGTLAVSAPVMNTMGAIYVYSRPDGSGQDWGDISYADGVKVSAAAVPSLGTNAASAPFDPSVAYAAGNARSCGSWCSRVWSNIATTGTVGVELGAHYVSLSADGRVMAVGARQKEFSSATVGGGFTNANRKADAGEVFVWVAPEGGWQSAPRADQDADGNAKTEIAAKTDASSFREATHYSPGPLRRWTEPAAILSPAAWPGRGAHLFGWRTAISPDGLTVAGYSQQNDGTHWLFQRDSVADWRALNGGYLTSGAALSSVSSSAMNAPPPAFSPDGTALAVGDVAYDGNLGSVLVFTRPADGTWVDAGAADATRWLEPAGGSANAYFGAMISETSGLRGVIVSRADRNYITRCSTSVVDGEPATTCPLGAPDTRIVIPKGTPDGRFTINARVTLAVDGAAGSAIQLRDSVEVTVGTIDELVAVEFDFATNTMGDTDPLNDRPYPSTVAPGGSTTLQLKLLNENIRPSATGAVSSVLFSTARGSLSAQLGGASGQACAVAGGLSCRIANPATTLTPNNSDKIWLTVTHPGAAKAGEARVRVVVVSSTGGTFRLSRMVTFGGPATALAITQPAASLLSYAPTEDTDQRNRATLVVSATDRAGNRATVPTGRYSAKLTGPDEKEVALTGAGARAGVAWPLRKGGAGADANDLVLKDGNPQARVSVLAGASTPLAVGEYTLELSVGSGTNKLTATQKFTVAGSAANVLLNLEPAGELEIDDVLTATVMVTDASGGPVPDGTPVNFTERSTGASAALVLTSSSTQRTRDGQASVTLRAVGGGPAYVQAEADGLSDVRSVRVAVPPPPPEPVTSTASDEFTIWTGAETITASELLSRLDGVSRVRMWQRGKWLTYETVDGRQAPGSVDFTIRRGNILWLSGG